MFIVASTIIDILIAVSIVVVIVNMITRTVDASFPSRDCFEGKCYVLYNALYNIITYIIYCIIYIKYNV